MSVKNFILSEFSEVINGQPWYGESVLKSINKIPLQIVNSRPSGASHSIASLIKHLISWRKFVIEKMNNNEFYDIKVDSTDDWNDHLTVSDENEWKQLLTAYEKSIELTVDHIRKFDESRFKDTVPGRSFSFEYMLIGILYHDIYHQGQINLLYSQLNN